MPTLRERFSDLILGDEKRRLREHAATLMDAYRKGPYLLPPDQLLSQLEEIDSSLLYDAVQRLTWERLGAGYGGDEEQERARAIDASRRLWKYDVLMQWSVQLWTDYGFGENVSIKPVDESAEETWLEFWGADRNQPVLAADELHHLSDMLLVDGEVFLAFYTSTLDGETTVRTINTKEITEIITGPADDSTALFYKRTWTDKEGVSHTWYYPDWQAVPSLDDDEATAPSIDNSTLPRDAVRADEQKEGTTVCLLHIAYNRKGTPRGWPLSTAAAPWSRTHKQFRENRATISAAIAMFVQKLKLKGGSRARDNVKAALQSAFVTGGTTETNPPPVAATWLENEAATLERLPMSTGAGDAKTDGEALAWQALLGFGLFPHYAGMGDAYRLATATSMEKPLLMQWSRYQLFWSAQFRKMVRIVLVMRERYGGAPFETYEAEVSTDRLVEVDLVAVSNAVTALFRETLFPAVEAGLIPSEAAQRIVAIIWRIALQALGVVDADEVASDEAFGVGMEPEALAAEPEELTVMEVEDAISNAVRVTQENLRIRAITAEQAAEFALGMLIDEGTGPGKGWWAPPIGTHGLGSQGGKGGEEGFASGEEADKWAQSQTSLNPDLSEEANDALQDYKGEYFYDINSDLREAGYSEMYDEHIEYIDAALAQTSLPRDMTLYRGSSFDAFEDFDDLTGDTITDQAFISTSMIEGIAAAHSDGAFIEIRVPKGTPALAMDRWRVTGWESESELLLPRGLGFKVISDTGIDSEPRNMVWEVVP